MSQPLPQDHALTPYQLSVIRSIIERNHAHFVNRYMMHAGCMWPDELMDQIVSSLAPSATGAGDGTAQKPTELGQSF